MRFTQLIGIEMIYLIMSLSFMFEFFKTHCTLKLRRKSMVFLWEEVSIVLDDIISLMLFLEKFLLQKNPLTLNSLAIPGSTALVLVLPPTPCQSIWTFLNVSYCTGNLGSVYIIFKNFCNKKGTHESSGVYHEMISVIAHIFQFIPNLKTPPHFQSCQ